MDDAGEQLSLLQGFTAPSRPAKTRESASELPVAQVLIDSPLPHLDRLFDYLVPAELDERARPGARVKVRFGGQLLAGFLVRRVDEASTGAKLSMLTKVVSPQPVLTDEVYELASKVAARWAGTVSDVLRVAIPPRVAGVEKEFDPASVVESPPSGQSRDDEAPAEPDSQPATLLPAYSNGETFLHRLRNGDSPRAVFTSVRGYGGQGWPHELAEALLVSYRKGHGAIAVLPDQKDLDRLEEALSACVPTDAYARLHADDGPTPRYRNFLKIRYGRAKIVIGTRSAAYAPVANLGLVCCWDDGDDLHIEQRAPYQHIREVLLLRAGQSGAAVLIGGLYRSTEAHRLVRKGWAQPIQPERAMARRIAPRVINTADSFERARDPLAVKARLPDTAWRTARDGLQKGPVLIQVARTGYAPNVACQRCREPARCLHCKGPLAQTSRDSAPLCRWCARPAHSWTCPFCRNQQLRLSTVGAGRTAEELGRAFPSVPVISSAGDHVHSSVSDTPALVVATPGAEPVAPSGYAAVLLLDGQSMLNRESLRAGEETLRRWFSAAALVRSAKDGGTVVITADEQTIVGHVVRWDPAGAADRELAQRQELELPPAVRVAALTGQSSALHQLIERADLPSSVRLIGPAPAPAPMAGSQRAEANDEVQVPNQRTLVFFSYADAANVTARLRATRAAMSAKRSGGNVQIRCDGVDLI
ncbi:MAG TPA: primosomal protein N' [Arthrobacter sp.]|nr:primosomal protein N' [Arthrobacter sp.]